MAPVKFVLAEVTFYKIMFFFFLRCLFASSFFEERVPMIIALILM